MGGFGIRKGEAERIHKMREAGLNVAEISRQTERSSGFVKKVLADAPVAVAVNGGGLAGDRKALADIVIGLDLPKAEKLKVLEAIL